jgi:DNA polymerase-1
MGLKGITKHRGEVKYLAGNLPVMATFSSFYIKNAPQQLETFAKDLDKIYSISLGIEHQEAFKESTAYEIVSSVKKAKKILDMCVTTGVCCFDYETTKLTDLSTLDPEFKATLLSISFQHGYSYCIPLFHFDSPFYEDEIISILEYFSEHVLANPEVIKVAHNFPFDFHVTERYVKAVARGRVDDTMNMYHLINEQGSKKLKDLVRHYFPNFANYETEVKKYAWHKVPLDILAKYAASDSDLTLRLRDYFMSILMQDERIYIHYRNMEGLIQKALVKAETNGMLITTAIADKNIARAYEIRDSVKFDTLDNRKVRKFETAYREVTKAKVIAELEAKKLDAKGKTLVNIEAKLSGVRSGAIEVYKGLNLKSVPQLRDLLYSEEGFGFPVPYVKKKRIVEEVTGKAYLLELNDKSGFIDNLLVLRSVEKTISTYLVGIRERLDAAGYVHTSFAQTGAESGRISSRNPNLQNLTSTSKINNEKAREVVKMVKQQFGVPAGYTLAQIDYSQLELRLIAFQAREENMLKAYQNNEDLHAKYASKLLNVTLEDFYKLDKRQQKDFRTKAKAGNFGWIYGMSPEGFMSYAKDNYGLILNLEEARKMRVLFFDMYPALLDYHYEMIQKGRIYGHVRTLFGRKRHLPNINDANDFIRGMDERVAINSPTQGTGGELTLLAAGLLNIRLDPRTLFVNTIHDSLLFYIPDDILEPQLKMIKYTCENVPIMKYFKREIDTVQIKVDIETTKTNWSELEPYNF